MKLKIFLAFFLVHFQFAFCQWVNLNTGINDNLTGVAFFQNNGLASGANGLYFTTTGGVGASSWTRFQITDNPASAAIYENTTFKHCYLDTDNYYLSPNIYACGQDRVTHKAVIMRITLPTLTYQIVYVGEDNSSLNKIGFYFNTYYAVGDNGLVVNFFNNTVRAVTHIASDNLSSISFKNNKCKITADGKIFYSASFDNTFSFVQILTPSSTNRDIDIDNMGGYTYTVGNKYGFSSNDTSITEYNNYDYGSLNASSIQCSDSNIFVGTDHGIFSNPYYIDYTILEWQPSSGNYPINEMWALESGSIVYACGDNGVILKNATSGGPRKPFVRINPIGGCVNTLLDIDATKATASSCSWYIDNQLVQSTCGNLSHNFTTSGDYEIKLTVQNNFGLQTTDTKIIHITSSPGINKPVTISDNILCHSETIEVTINNSEPNVVYTLKKDLSAATYGTSGIGNGGIIIFTSNQINSSGNYFLQARNALGSCTVNFSDIIPITVEQTKADFHADLINAKTNEVVNLYGKTSEAQNFKWDFTSNAPLITSNLEHPSVAFPVAGPATINLDCWSNNGCHDVTQKASFVYDEPTNPNNCWTLVNRAPDPAWNGHFYDGIGKSTPTLDGGFLTCGNFKDGVLDSKIGINHSVLAGSAYLEKHDKNGALKWVVYLKDERFPNSRSQMFSTVVDQLGDIYVCGTGSGKFIDNHGDAYNLDGVSGSQGALFIIKLDSKGKFIWKLTNSTAGFSPSRLYIDRDNNLVATGVIFTTSGTQVNSYMFLNNQLSFILTQALTSSNGGYSDNQALVKLSPSGALIWNVGINLHNTNGADLADVGFDINNNIYLTGMFEYYGKFYSVGNPTPDLINGSTGQNEYMFLVKYSPNGIFQWKTRSTLMGSIDSYVSSSAMVTDDDGTCYITGSNSRKVVGSYQTFENTDGSVTQNNIGDFYVLKVNPSGVCQWIMGDNSTKSSYGEKIIKEGNKLHIVGKTPTTTAAEPLVFTGSNLDSYSLVMNYNDLFMVTYDTNGNLIRVITSGETVSGNNAFEEIKSFFKGDGDSYYLSRNLEQPINLNFFGINITPTDDVDAMITKFDVSCGILKYQSQLSVNDLDQLSGITLYPNPTNGNFMIDLKVYQSEVAVEIFDVLGKRVSSQKLFNVSQINTSIHADKGMYFVKVGVNDKINYFKVIKN